MKRCPVIISDSLLARYSFFPLFTAASADTSPADPTIAAITESHSPADAIEFNASLPLKTSVLISGWFFSSVRTFSAADSCCSTAYAGLNSIQSLIILSAFEPAPRAYTQNKSLFLRTTSRVLCPMEPVDPSTVKFSINFLFY